MAGDRNRYPQILDLDKNEWHRRSLGDDGYGPTYFTMCGKFIETFTVDVPEGEPESWQTRCKECYR